MLSDVVSNAKAFMSRELGLAAQVVAVERSGDAWLVTVEAVTPDPEMRRFAKRDMVATFQLAMAADHQVVSFTRKAVRERGTAPEQ